MKRVIAWSFLLLLSLNTSAARPQGLRFAADGTFRIVQFTDTHLDPQTPERQAEAEKTFARIDRIIRTEHPDLLVFTFEPYFRASCEDSYLRKEMSEFFQIPVVHSVNVHRIDAFC